MKRNGPNWMLRVMLTALVVAGMSMPASSADTVPQAAGSGMEQSPHPAAAISAHTPVIPVVDGETLAVLDVRDPVLDDASQDGADDLRIPSQMIEMVLLCGESSRIVAGPHLNHLAEAGLATQMVCCAWRC